MMRREGKVFYNLKFENHSQTPLDKFMIQFNKNTFGLAAGGPLQVSVIQPSGSATTLLPMVLFQNVSEGPPNSQLQVAVKNNQQPVWYFSDKIPLQALFVEEGKMERGTFLETWKSLPDSHEIAKDLPNALIYNVDATLEKLATTNLFYIARRALKDTNQEILYLSGKVPPNIPFLVEITCKVGVPNVKCAVKTPIPEMAPLFFEAIESLLK
jgi:AP-1 complex subunit beta-1